MAQTLKFGNKVWAAKEDSVLAYNDINNNYKPLPFDFARASIGTRVNKDGLIETMGQDIARIDYTDSADGVLLLEFSSTNLIPYSEDFENSDWTKNAGTTITNNYAISPDGTLNASRFLGTGTSGLGDKFTLSATDNTISFWVKSNNGVNQFCTLLGDSNQRSEDLLVTTEWARISYTFTASGLSDKTNGIFRDLNDNDIDILIYGAQLEQNSYPSSYIATSGSSVTRAAETCNNSGNSEVFNDSEGVLFFDGSVFTTNESLCISVNDGGVTGSGNRVELLWFSDGNFYTQVGNSGQEFISSNTFYNKILIKYGSGSYDLYVNGFRRITDTFTSLTGLVSLDFKRQGSFTFKGKTKELGYYDTALTDAELETLTSYRNWVSMVNELNLNIIYNG